MATAQTSTTTHGAAPKLTDPDAVETLLDEYELILNYRIEDGHLSLWGYNYFSPYKETDYGRVDELETELLYRLSQFIEEGDRLDLRTVSFTKCRHVSAIRWVVEPYKVSLEALGDELEIIEPPETIGQIIPEESVQRIQGHIANETDETNEENEVEAESESGENRSEAQA